MSAPDNCPNCNTSWKEDKTIYDHFLDKYGDKDKAASAAIMYGCTPDNPKHFSKGVIGIEIRGVYDGVLYWECKSCEHIIHRLTGEIFEEMPKEHKR